MAWWVMYRNCVMVSVGPRNLRQRSDLERATLLSRPLCSYIVADRGCDSRLPVSGHAQAKRTAKRTLRLRLLYGDALFANRCCQVYQTPRAITALRRPAIISFRSSHTLLPSLPPYTYTQEKPRSALRPILSAHEAHF